MDSSSIIEMSNDLSNSNDYKVTPVGVGILCISSYCLLATSYPPPPLLSRLQYIVCIPPELANVESLERLYLQCNGLGGEVSSVLFALRF